MLEFKSPTDKTHPVKLESSIETIRWAKSTAAIGSNIGLEVITKFVGNNSDISIVLIDKSGKKLDSIKDKIFGNKFWISLPIPEKAEEELFAEVKLPKHGLNKRSDSLYLFPQIIISNAKWEKPTTFLGDTLKIKADVKGIADGNEVEIQIWENSPIGAHDLITKFPALIKNGKINTQWEFQYDGTVDELLALIEAGHEKVPRFFYKVIVAGVTAESDLIIMNWLLIELIGEDGKPVPDVRFSIVLPDKSLRQGKLDKEGRYFCYDLEKEGNCKISFPEIDKDAWEEI